MVLRDARKYISELRKRQSDPYLWPDFLTGLPDKTAILRKINEIYPSVEKYSISFIRISNIHPYLIKYGYERHAEIIQWAAAILKTALEDCEGFLGAYETHDFVAIYETQKCDSFFQEASDAFVKKTGEFYSDADLQSGAVLSFTRGRKQVRIGLMRLIEFTVKGMPGTPREQLLPYLEAKCTALEKKGAPAEV